MIGKKDRHKLNKSRKHLWKNGPDKNLIQKLKNSGGRNNDGRITANIRGRYRKKMRIVDFKRVIDNQDYVVLRLEYDPLRSAHIALIEKVNKIEKKNNNTEINNTNYNRKYIISPEGLKVGDIIGSYDNPDISQVGNSSKLKNLPKETKVCCVELYPNKGAVLARSAGSFAIVGATSGGYTTLKLRSGEERLVSSDCIATIGVPSNIVHREIRKNKAGTARRLGWKSHVRGIAMNPVDHYMGGRTDGGKAPASFNGRLSKGGKTRNKNKTSSKFILTKRK